VTESKPKHTASPIKALWIIFIGLPPLFLLLMYVFFRVDIPYLDQWEFVLFLEKWHEGTLGMAEFWAQHNEHRLLFPRLIMLGLASLSSWNVELELLTNTLLGTAIFALVTWQVRRTMLQVKGPPVWGVLVLVSLLLFTLSQWRNWFLGWQLQVFLNVLAVVGICILLSAPIVLSPAGMRRLWLRFMVSLILAVVAAYSFANGILAWPVGLVLLILTREREDQSREARLTFWCLGAGATTLSYLMGYHSPGHHPAINAVFGHLLSYPVYVCKYLGQPIVSFSGMGAALCGAAGVVFWLGSAYLLMKRHPKQAWRYAPYVGLGLYAVGSALLTGLARVDMSTAQAMSPRYVTLANLLWASNIMLAYLILTPRTDTGTPLRNLRTPIAVVGALLALFISMSSLYGAYRWTERYAVYERARVELLAGEDKGNLHYLYPDVAVLLERRAILQRYGLSIFR
jgi:hypothetical protein